MPGYNLPSGCTQDALDRENDRLSSDEESDDIPAMNFRANVEPFYVKLGGRWVTEWNVEVKFLGMQASSARKHCKTRTQAEIFIGESIMDWAESRTR